LTNRVETHHLKSGARETSCWSKYHVITRIKFLCTN
jgi:hypothetical protein